MPKEIDNSPSSFSESIGIVRMEVRELIALLKKCNVGADAISAISNKAEFDGLEDIESALQRFSGNPIISFNNVKIRFDRLNTEVSSGYQTIGTPTADLANQIAHELKAFNSPIEHRIYKISSILNWISGLLFFAAVVFIWRNGINKSWILIEQYMSSYPFLILMILGALTLNTPVEAILKRRVSVYYRPRETFWQRRGETVVWSLVSGVLMLLIGKYII